MPPKEKTPIDEVVRNRTAMAKINEKSLQKVRTICQEIKALLDIKTDTTEPPKDDAGTIALAQSLLNDQKINMAYSFTTDADELEILESLKKPACELANLIVQKNSTEIFINNVLSYWHWLGHKGGKSGGVYKDPQLTANKAKYEEIEKIHNDYIKSIYPDSSGQIKEKLTLNVLVNEIIAAHIEDAQSRCVTWVTEQGIGYVAQRASGEASPTSPPPQGELYASLVKALNTGPIAKYSVAVDEGGKSFVKMDGVLQGAEAMVDKVISKILGGGSGGGSLRDNISLMSKMGVTGSLAIRNGLTAEFLQPDLAAIRDIADDQLRSVEQRRREMELYKKGHSGWKNHAVNFTMQIASNSSVLAYALAVVVSPTAILSVTTAIVGWSVHSTIALAVRVIISFVDTLVESDKSVHRGSTNKMLRLENLNESLKEEKFPASSQIMASLEDIVRDRFWTETIKKSEESTTSSIESADASLINSKMTMKAFVKNTVHQLDVYGSEEVVGHPENNNILSSAYETMICYGYEKDVTAAFKRMFLDNVFGAIIFSKDPENIEPDCTYWNAQQETKLTPEEYLRKYIDKYIKIDVKNIISGEMVARREAARREADGPDTENEIKLNEKSIMKCQSGLIQKIYKSIKTSLQLLYLPSILPTKFYEKGSTDPITGVNIDRRNHTYRLISRKINEKIEDVSIELTIYYSNYLLSLALIDILSEDTIGDFPKSHEMFIGSSKHTIGGIINRPELYRGSRQSVRKDGIWTNRTDPGSYHTSGNGQLSLAKFKKFSSLYDTYLYQMALYRPIKVKRILKNIPVTMGERLHNKLDKSDNNKDYVYHLNSILPNRIYVDEELYAGGKLNEVDDKTDTALHFILNDNIEKYVNDYMHKIDCSRETEQHVKAANCSHIHVGDTHLADEIATKKTDRGEEAVSQDGLKDLLNIIYTRAGGSLRVEYSEQDEAGVAKWVLPTSKTKSPEKAARDVAKGRPTKNTLYNLAKLKEYLKSTTVKLSAKPAESKTHADEVDRLDGISKELTKERTNLQKTKDKCYKKLRSGNEQLLTDAESAKIKQAEEELDRVESELIKVKQKQRDVGVEISSYAEKLEKILRWGQYGRRAVRSDDSLIWDLDGDSPHGYIQKEDIEKITSEVSKACSGTDLNKKYIIIHDSDDVTSPASRDGLFKSDSVNETINCVIHLKFYYKLLMLHSTTKKANEENDICHYNEEDGNALPKYKNLPYRINNLSYLTGGHNEANGDIQAIYQNTFYGLFSSANLTAELELYVNSMFSRKLFDMYAQTGFLDLIKDKPKCFHTIKIDIPKGSGKDTDTIYIKLFKMAVFFDYQNFLCDNFPYVADLYLDEIPKWRRNRKIYDDELAKNEVASDQRSTWGGGGMKQLNRLTPHKWEDQLNDEEWRRARAIAEKGQNELETVARRARDRLNWSRSAEKDPTLQYDKAMWNCSGNTNVSYLQKRCIYSNIGTHAGGQNTEAALIDIQSARLKAYNHLRIFDILNTAYNGFKGAIKKASQFSCVQYWINHLPYNAGLVYSASHDKHLLYDFYSFSQRILQISNRATGEIKDLDDSITKHYMETIINRFAGGGRGLPGIQNHLVSNYNNDKRAPLNSLGFILNTFNINDIVALSSTNKEDDFARANIDGIYGNGDTLVAEALLPSLNRVASHVPMGLQSLDHKYWFYYDPHRHCNILQFQGTVDELVDSLANVSTNTLTHRLTSTDMVDFISDYFSKEDTATMRARTINYTFKMGKAHNLVTTTGISSKAMSSLYALQFISDMKSMGTLDDNYKQNIHANNNNETFMLQSILPYNIHKGVENSPYKHEHNPKYHKVLYALKFAIFNALLVKLGLVTSTETIKANTQLIKDNMQLIKDYPLFIDKVLLNMSISTMSYLNTFSIQFIPQILADVQSSIGSMFSAVRAKEIYESNEKRVKLSQVRTTASADANAEDNAASTGEGGDMSASKGTVKQTDNEDSLNTNGDWLEEFNIIISQQLSKTLQFDMNGNTIVDKNLDPTLIENVYNLFCEHFNRSEPLPINYQEFNREYSNILGKLILDTTNTNSFTNYCVKPDNIITTQFDIPIKDSSDKIVYELGTEEFYNHDILNLRSGLMERARSKSKVLINRKRLHSDPEAEPHSEKWDIAIANHKNRRRLMNGGLGRRLGMGNSNPLGDHLNVKVSQEDLVILKACWNKKFQGDEFVSADEVSIEELLRSKGTSSGSQPLYNLGEGRNLITNKSYMIRGEEKKARDEYIRVRQGPAIDAVSTKIIQVAQATDRVIGRGVELFAQVLPPGMVEDSDEEDESSISHPSLHDTIDAYGEADIELFPWKQFYREGEKWEKYKRQLSDMYKKMKDDVRYAHNRKCIQTIFKSTDGQHVTGFHFCDKIIWSMANGREVKTQGEEPGGITLVATETLKKFFKSIISPDYDIITPDQLLEYLKQPHCDQGLSKYSIMESIDNLLPGTPPTDSRKSQEDSFINAIHSVKITNNSDSKASFSTDVEIELAPTYESDLSTPAVQVTKFFEATNDSILRAIKKVPMHTGCSPDNGIASELLFNTLILGKYDDTNYTIDSTAAAFKSLEDYSDITSLPRIDSHNGEKHAVMYTSYSKAIEEYSKIFGHTTAPKLAVTGHSMGGGYSSTFGYMCVYKLITLRKDPSIFKELLDITAPMKVHSWAPPRSFNPTTTIFMDTVDKIFDFKTNTPSNMMQKTVVNISNKHDPIYKIPWINQHIGANIIIDESITNRPGMLLSHAVEEIDAIQKQLQFQKEHGTAVAAARWKNKATHKGAEAEAVAAALAEAAATSVIEAKHYIVMPTKQETTVKLEECHKKYIYEKCGEYLTWKLCEVKEYLKGFKTNEWILKSREESKVEQCSKEYLISMIGKILTILHVRCNDTPGTIKADIINLKKCYYRHNGLDIGGSVNLEVLKNSLDTIITHLEKNMKDEFSTTGLCLDSVTPSQVSIYKNVHRNDALFNSQLWSIKSNKFFAHKSTLISNTPLQCLQIDTDISTERVTITGDIRKKNTMHDQECNEPNAYMINALDKDNEVLEAEEEKLRCRSGIITHVTNRRLDEFAGWVGGDYSVEKQFIERCIVRDIQIDPVEWKYLVPKDVRRLEECISHHPYQKTAVRDATAVNIIARQRQVNARAIFGMEESERIDDEINMSERLLDTKSPAPPINWTDKLRTKLVSELEIDESAATEAKKHLNESQAKELLCLVEEKHIEYNNIVSLIPSKAYGRDYSYTAGGQHATPSYLIAAYKFNQYNAIHRDCKQSHKATVDLVAKPVGLGNKTADTGHLNIFNNISLKDIMFSNTEQAGDYSLENILERVYTSLESNTEEQRPKKIDYNTTVNSIIIDFIGKIKTKTYTFKGINCIIDGRKYMINFVNIKKLITPTLGAGSSKIKEARAKMDKTVLSRDWHDKTLKLLQKKKVEEEAQSNGLAGITSALFHATKVVLGGAPDDPAESMKTSREEIAKTLWQQRILGAVLEERVKSFASMSSVFQIAIDVLEDKEPYTNDKLEVKTRELTSQENMNKFLTASKTIHYGTSSYYSLIQLITLINHMLTEYNMAIQTERDIGDHNRARHRDGKKELNTATVKDSTIYANQLISFIKLVITPGSSSPESAAILVNTDEGDKGNMLMF
jgi:hypothetical protein